MLRQLTVRSSLDSLKKEAKRWLNAVRDADPDALARLKQALPSASLSPGLREIQQALAREHGFESWAALKQHLADEALARRTHAERIRGKNSRQTSGDRSREHSRRSDQRRRR